MSVERLIPAVGEAMKPLLPEMAPQEPATSIVVTIPAALRARRRALGWTLDEVAEAVGTTGQTIQRLETGNMTMSLEWLEKMLRAMGLEISDVVQPRRRAEIYNEAAREVAKRYAKELRATADEIESRYGKGD